MQSRKHFCGSLPSHSLLALALPNWPKMGRRKHLTLKGGHITLPCLLLLQCAEDVGKNLWFGNFGQPKACRQPRMRTDAADDWADGGGGGWINSWHGPLAHSHPQQSLCL